MWPLLHHVPGLDQERRADVTIGSLFSGIGGLELGLERAGLGPVLWQAECDPYCLSVLERHWPDARRYADVREVDEHAPRVDVLCGGFPCQPVSVAGKRRAQQDPRWLWPEFQRVIAAIRPRWVVIENVPGLRTAGLLDVLRGLAACGYDAEWRHLSAEDLGAPHRRRRIFVVAYPSGELVREQSGRGSGSNGEGQAFPDHDGADGSLADTDGARELQPRRVLEDLGRWARDCGGSWATEPDVGRVAHGVPARAHRLRALGNAVVPQCAEVIGRCIVSTGRHR